MESIVVALSSNERYFPGLYCAVASTLSHLNPSRKANVKVLDGGISQASKHRLSALVQRLGRHACIEFVTVDLSVFSKAALGPGESYMSYCRILLPHVFDVPRLLYLDCDVLVFRDVSELFDLELCPGKILAASPDSETMTLGDDSRTIADSMKLSVTSRYFNAGVAVFDLDEFRRQRFSEQSLEFFNNWKGHYRFHDQSAINFLLHGQIQQLPEYWNRPSWRFDDQQNNDLNCIVHYTRLIPWFGGKWGPAQVLFEQFATEAGLPINRTSSEFKRSTRQNLWRNALAPLRALVFPIASVLYRIAGRTEKAAAYKKVGRYWFDYIRNTPSRRRLYCQRSEQLSRTKFGVHSLPVVS